MSGQKAIVCDWCGAVGTIQPTGRTDLARQELRGTGWRLALPGSLDMCHGCYVDGLVG